MSEAATVERRFITPFNVIAALILATGAVVLFIRFTQGLSATTNLNHDFPWGLWIGFDVMSGVALAAGGFTISTAVYLFGMKEYRAIVRPALLTAFLGYALVVVGLLADLGRPWRLPYAFVVQSGPTSALFEVALCVGLYLTTLFIESLPPAFEWLGFKRMRRIIHSSVVALTIFGLMLSTMHQSSLGGLFTIAPTRLHPLWYSPHIPVHFFVSAIGAGISMLIVESMISHRVFRDQVELTHKQFDNITIGLAKAGAIVFAIYFGIRVAGLALEDDWHYLGTGYGALYLVEMIGFVLLPVLLFSIGYRERRPGLVRATGVLAVLGIVFNRLNVCFIAYNWELPAGQRYVPHWMEIAVTLALITAGVVAFRWIANHMPIMYEHPDYKGGH